MFLEFYQLREQPFGVTPDPRFLYFGAAHREALASLQYALQEKRGFSALVAEPGMGKTSILFRMLAALRESARTAFLFQTEGDTRDLLRSLLADLGISSPTADLHTMRETLHGVLLQEMHAGRPVVLVIDEAQNLGDELLESVRMLSNFETPVQKLMHIVLAGQPALAEKLSAQRMVQLRQRIGSVIRLEPFGLQETAEYIQHRLRAAGHLGAPLFSPEAYELIAQSSHGIPRNINTICFQALSLGVALQVRRIGPEILREVIADSDFAARPLPRPRFRPPVVPPLAAPRIEPAAQPIAEPTSQRVSAAEKMPTPAAVPALPERPHAQAPPRAESTVRDERPQPARPAAPPRPAAASPIHLPIPGLVTPARSQRRKWIAFPLAAAVPFFAVLYFGPRVGANGPVMLRSLLAKAKTAAENTRGEMTEVRSALQPASTSPPQPSVPQPPVSEQSEKQREAAPVAAVTPPAADPHIDQPARERSFIVLPRQMTAADVARTYLGDSDWHTMYKLLALNPDIGWSYQEIPKGTRVVLPLHSADPGSPPAPDSTPSAKLAALPAPALTDAHKGPTLVEVTHSESLFQLALENYGKSSWVMVSEICKLNPQLQGVYDTLQEGDWVKIPDPADLPTPPAKPDAATRVRRGH